jgi:hypothetical protein
LGYNPNIPTSTDLLSNSQVDIKSNFLTANTVMGINHYAFDVVSGNQGKHKFTELVNLSTPAGTVPPGLAGSETTLYSRTLTGTSQLCATPGTSGNEFQLTSMNNADFATFGTSPDGWTFLPGGLIMNWGTGMGQTDSSFTYSRDFTGAPYTVQVTPLDTNNGRIFLWVKTISATNFTIASRDSSGLDTTIKFTWIALGFA